MTQNRAHLAALSKATFAVVVWGASFIATKIALRDVAPVTVIWLRFGIGVVILGVIMLAREKASLPSLRDLAYFSLLGFLGITFHQWLQVTGLVTARATTTAWIITTIPIFIAILGRVVLNERLGWDRIGGIALACVGVLLVVSRGNVESILRCQIGSTGDLLVFLSAPNWAVFSILSRKALQRHPATQMMFYVMAFGWVFTSVWLTASGNFGEVFHISSGGWISVLFLGVLCSGFAYIFWYDALKVLTASQLGSLLYIEPLVAVVVAAFLLAEPIFLAAILGGALILAGVWLVNRLRTPEGPPE
jgi:drug/metabolite transporter (DMT)-like permease